MEHNDIVAKRTTLDGCGTGVAGEDGEDARVTGPLIVGEGGARLVRPGRGREMLLVRELVDAVVF